MGWNVPQVLPRRPDGAGDDAAPRAHRQLGQAGHRTRAGPSGCSTACSPCCSKPQSGAETTLATPAMHDAMMAALLAGRSHPHRRDRQLRRWSRTMADDRFHDPAGVLLVSPLRLPRELEPPRLQRPGDEALLRRVLSGSARQRLVERGKPARDPGRAALPHRGRRQPPAPAARRRPHAARSICGRS